MWRKLFSSLDIRQRNQRLLLIILVFFLVSFGISRAFAVYIGTSVWIKGYQIHHFYFGTAMLACSSVIAILYRSERVAQFASVLAGIGLGLFADEIGLLLNCTTLYRQCRYQFPDYLDFIGAIATIIVILIIFSGIIESNGKNGDE